MKQKLCKQLIRNNALKYFLLTLVISFYLLREFEAPTIYMYIQNHRISNEFAQMAANQS